MLIVGGLASRALIGQIGSAGTLGIGAGFASSPFTSLLLVLISICSLRVIAMLSWILTDDAKPKEAKTMPDPNKAPSGKIPVQ